MVAVVLRDRAFGDVLADMVEGVVIANGLQGPAASRVRRTLLDAIDPMSSAPEVATAISVAPIPARVAKRQTQAA